MNQLAASDTSRYIQVGNVADLQEAAAAEGSTGNTKVEGIKVVVCTCTDSRTRKMFIAPTRNAIASVPAMYSPKSHTYRVGPNHPTGVAAPPYQNRFDVTHAE